ncbi:TetR/AcrR family transcriptional regulator [Frankia sp. AvcI1]|uniref:TetR/AcrR family transcriptional regulator n=2 Tax=Frankia sp. AvcI1 TaxID=573496 RepID=UPI0021181626|nr:TetR/AcrR family transcriptional regulator [Frankia sp. AvcI1]
MRADARRNYERLLAEARVAFAEHGTGASLEDIARRAGVGTGTLYRHFPAREALLEAVLREEFQRLTASAGEAAAARPAGPALLAWLRELVAFNGTYRGLTAALMQPLLDPASELHAACEAMRTAGGDLLRAAQQAGRIRPDVTVLELFTLVSGLSWAHEQTSAALPGSLAPDRLLHLTVEGLAPRPAQSGVMQSGVMQSGAMQADAGR